MTSTGGGRGGATEKHCFLEQHHAQIPFSSVSQPPSSSSSSRSRAVAVASNKVHSLAERRRRERINAHLATLRRMVPNSGKLDKASLLGKVIEQVRDLKRKISIIRTRGLRIPNVINEVEVDLFEQQQHPIIKASICCNDRPDLFADIAQELGQLEVRTVRVETVTVGGRVQSVFFLCKQGVDNGGGRDGQEAGDELGSMLGDVRAALGRVSSVDATAQGDGMYSKGRMIMQMKCFG